MPANPLPEEFLQRFRQLVAERITRAESMWFSLVQGTGDEQAADELERIVHTLKGDAQMVGIAEVELICHKLENLLAVARDAAYAVAEDIDLLVTMSFHFIGLLARKRVGSSVAGIDLDGFVREVDQAVLAARALAREPDGRVGSAQAMAHDDVAPDLGSRLALAATMAFLEQLGAKGDSQQRLRQLWSMLLQEVAPLCSVVLAPLAERHCVAARALCEQLGKLVHAEVETHGVCVTRRVADAVDVGLLHCTRNAVAHGLELPHERAAAGKPTRGALGITAEMIGDVVEIAIEDDGRGLDLEAITRRALELGLLDEAAHGRASTLDVHDLLFRPGFSTASATTPLSGRGVGLDAARSALCTVGGDISAFARAGGGTRILIRVPALVQDIQVHVFEARPDILLALPVQWVLTPGLQTDPWVVDPLEALGLADRSDRPDHVLKLRWGLLQANYAVATMQSLATARRICPTPSTEAMEVVRIDGRDILLLRPDKLQGAAQARARGADERAV